MPLKYVHNLIPEICAYVTLLLKGTLQIYLRLWTLKWRAFLGWFNLNPWPLKHNGLSLAEGGRDQQKGNQEDYKTDRNMKHGSGMFWGDFPPPPYSLSRCKALRSVLEKEVGSHPSTEQSLPTIHGTTVFQRVMLPENRQIPRTLSKKGKGCGCTEEVCLSPVEFTEGQSAT